MEIQLSPWGFPLRDRLKEFLQFCTVCSLKSSSSLVFLTPPRKDFHNPQNFPASGDAHALCSLPAPVPCVAGDWEDKCWDEHLTSLGVQTLSSPWTQISPKLLLPFAALRREKQSRQKHPQTACGFMVGCGSEARDREGRGVGERDRTTKVGKISSDRRWGPTFSLSPPYPRKGK